LSRHLEAMNAMNKTKIKIVTGVLLVFFLGVGTGVVGTGIVIRRSIRGFMNRASGSHGTFFMNHLERELRLTDAQKRNVEKIVEDGEVEIREILRRSRETFVASMEQRRIQLRALLLPEQQQKLDAMFERFQKRWPPLPSPPPSK